MQLSLFRITEEEIFQAYYDCRKHKRNTHDAIEFELDLEHNLFLLLDEINSFSYTIGQSSVFVVDKPVMREVFAASFRDRIVHHLLINLIGSCLEKSFVFDSYACRVGKGTHLGVSRLNRAISSNLDGWVLKMDISSFFMSIDRVLLWKRLKEYLLNNCGDMRISIILSLIKLIIFNDPTKNCIYHSPKSKWDKLPKEKSLFFSRKNCGLPIGNLTSQIFASFYMSALDHYVKHDLGFRWYGRYVDDFFLVHSDKSLLLESRDKISTFVEKELKLKINRKKTYLQRCDKGVRFLGVKIEVGHINVIKRTVNNFKSIIDSINNDSISHKLKKRELDVYRSRVNSYLGIISHYNTFRLRRDIINTINPKTMKRIIRRKGIKSIKVI